MGYIKLNAKNLFILFGVLIEKGGYDTFLQFPKRKKSLTNNFPEQDGIDIDLSEPKFEAREFILKCYLIGDDRDDFWSKYNGLFTELSLAGELTLQFEDLAKTFLLYYQDQQNVSKLSRINANSNKVYMKFDLHFSEVDPSDNIVPVFLVDDQDRFLII